MKDPFEFAQQLYRYATGKLSAEERERVEETLHRDRELDELADELQDKHSIQKELQTIMTFDAEKALRKVGRHQKTHGFRMPLWSAAAAVAVVLIGTWLLWQHKQMARQPEEVSQPMVMLETAGGECYALDTLSTLRLEQGAVEVNNREGVLHWEESREINETPVQEAYNKVRVPNGSTYSMILPDGTRVYLNSGTTLEFPSRFSAVERRIRISGEVYCEVIHNGQQPFIVETGDMSVKVLGTVFNVKAYPDEPEIYTTLVSGRVLVQVDHQAGEPLMPGEMAVYSRQSGQVRVCETDVEEQTAWKDGIFYFKALSLEDILRVVARWYDLEVFYANDDLRTVVFNGKMPMYSSVEDVLRKFEYADEVGFELKGKTLTVYRK